MSNKFFIDMDNVECRLNIKAETIGKVTDRLADKVLAQLGDEVVQEVIDGLDKGKVRNSVVYQLIEKALDALIEKWRDE